ncbi:hypothetical protein ACFQY7_48655 [Actinomadura luteofluorescens]
MGERPHVHDADQRPAADERDAEQRLQAPLGEQRVEHAALDTCGT